MFISTRLISTYPKTHLSKVKIPHYVKILRTDRKSKQPKYKGDYNDKGTFLVRRRVVTTSLWCPNSGTKESVLFLVTKRH